MKRRFTILTAALALLVSLAIPMGMWGQTSVTWPGTTALPGTATAVANDQNVTIMVSSTNTYSNPIRIYANTTVTINALNNAKILSVAYEASSTGNYVTYAQNATVTPNVTPTVSGKIVTWTYAESANVTEFTFKPSAQTRSNGITITYIIPSATPTCATPTFNPAAGTYTQTQNVSINCSTEGATIYYTIDGNDPTTNSSVYSGAINVSTNTTIKAMATAEGYDNSAIATAEYAFITLEHAGTLEDPYSVADARTAIDAGTGTQGVYATGIVSAIPTAWNSQYSNITFDFVDNAGDTDVLEAYRCASGTGVDASQVAVGDVVVVYGNLTKYGSTYEFGQGCTLVSLTHPAITTPVVTVTPNTINAPAEGADGTLALTYENIEEYISFDYYFCDANGNELEDTDPDYPGDWIYAEINEDNDAYTLDYIIDANNGAARTAYIKVYTFDDEAEEVYDIVTVNQEEYVAPTYAELPFEFNGGTSDIEGTDGLYQEGLGDYSASTNPTTKLKFDGTGDWLLLQFNERPGTLTFDIKNNNFSGGTFKVQTSENGVTFTDLKTYTEISGTQNEVFTNLGENVRYIKWIYTEKVSGNVGLGNITLAEYTEPQQYTLTVEPFENLELITFVNDEMVMEGDGEITVTEGDEIMLSIVALEGYEMETLMVNGENHVDDIAEDYTYTFQMPAENVTISATAVEDVPVTPGTWVLTDLADLTADDVFVIVGDNGDTYAMSNDKGTSAAPAAVAVTVVEGTLSAEPAANLQWNITITEDGYTFYPNGETETWLYCTNTNNGVRVGINTNNVFVLDNESGYLKNVATSRYIGIYNSQDWRCYTNTTGNIAGQTFAFYKKVVEPATETYPLTIQGYGDNSNSGGYYLIASPLGTINPANVPDMLSNTYDLYYFDQDTDGNGNEWINYKGGSFDLEPGTGYLYAHNSTITLNFTGTPIESTSYEVTLRRNESARFKGWNLVGNPFTGHAYLADNRDFYTMNTSGTAFELVGAEDARHIEAVEGVFVIASSDKEKLNFTTSAPAKKGNRLALNLSQGNNVIDRAFIRFGECRQMPKLQFNQNSTKVYIPMDDEDYAVVRAEEMGEMPVNFKAESNGTYSLNFGMDNVEFAYLHLIDNLTGNDVDLLQTPSYSFEAKTTDYESRFKLVFATGDNSNEDNFAYFSNGSFVINNEGNATLQVIDITGRIVKSESVNGCANVNVNGTAGVYMLRLVNGDNVKVQKVVVK